MCIWFFNDTIDFDISWNVVSSAKNGIEALKALEEEPSKYDLVLSDIVMPEMDGFGLLGAIRASGSLKHLPVILMSATGDHTTANKSVMDGSEDYIPKPVGMAFLKRRLDSVVAALKASAAEKRHEEALAELAEENMRKEQEISALKSRVAEMDQMQKQVAAAIETPIAAITKTLSRLTTSAQMGDQEELRAELTGVLKALSGPDLHRPAFAKLLSAQNLDQDTKNWLIAEYTPERALVGAASTGNVSDPASSSSPKAGKEGGVEDVGTTDSPSLSSRGGGLDVGSSSRPSSGAPKPKAADVKRTDVSMWDFRPYDMTPDELLPYLEAMFEQLDLIQTYNIDRECLHRFFRVVSRSYLPNAYHNFQHAFDVTQTVFVLLTSTNVTDYLTKLDLLILMVSAICHDIEHPGLNNAFQISTGTPLAMFYNDRSVLENHHCHRTFQILKTPDTAILDGMDIEQWREFRAGVITAILATDMGHHFEVTQKFQSRLENGDNWSRESADDRTLLIRILIKVADISNPAKPHETALVWSKRLHEEWYLQGDKEREAGLPVTPIMDRSAAKPAKIAADFIDYILSPLYNNMARLLPGFEPCLELMRKNREYWQTQLDAQEEEAVAAGAPTTSEGS